MTRKKLLMLLGSVCLALAMVVMACTGPAPTTPAPTTPAPTTPAPTTPAPAPEVIEWKLQHHRIAAERAMMYYKDMLENKIPELTGGRLKIKLYYGGELVKSADITDAVSTGTLEMAVTSAYYHKGIMPEAGIEYGLPFGIRTPMELYNFMYGEEMPGFFGGWKAIDFLRSIYAEHDIYYLAGGLDCWPASFMTTFPVNSIADLKGKKMRGAGLMNDWVAKIGGEGVYIPGEELYTALATGAIDAVSWGSGMGNYSMGFHEVCKYFLYPPLMPLNSANAIVNMDAWNSLPDDIKGILEMALKEVGLDFAAHSNITGEAWSLNKMDQEYGVTLCELTGDDLKKAEEAAFEIWDEQAALSPRCAQYVEMIRDYMRTMGYV
ncbi:Monocarboxylate 2-oxoacid-binding periplasmic protein [subsurface metagenome]